MAKEFERKFLPSSKEAITALLSTPSVSKTEAFLFQGYVEDCDLSMKDGVLYFMAAGFTKLLTVDFNATPEKRAEAERIVGLKDVDPHFTVRFRVARGVGYLTIKTSQQDELEEEVGERVALFFLENACVNKISKMRYTVPREGSARYWEIDVFKGHREGLILIEAEVDAMSEVLELPEWVGAEVTGNKAYSNYRLGLPQ